MSSKKASDQRGISGDDAESFSKVNLYTGKSEKAFQLKEQILEYARKWPVSHCRQLVEGDGPESGYLPERPQEEQVWTTETITAATLIDPAYAKEWPINSYPMCRANSTKAQQESYTLAAKSHKEVNDMKALSNSSKRAANEAVMKYFLELSSKDIKNQFSIRQKSKPHQAPMTIGDLWELIDSISGKTPWFKELLEWIKEIGKPLSIDSFGQFHSSWSDRWKKFWDVQKLPVPDENVFFCLHLLLMYTDWSNPVAWPDNYNFVFKELIYKDPKLSEVTNYAEFVDLIKRNMQFAEEMPGKKAGGGGKSSAALNRVTESTVLSKPEMDLITKYRGGTKELRRRIHAASNSETIAAPSGKDNSVCHFFLKGNCKYGDKCTRSHQSTTDTGKRAASDNTEAADTTTPSSVPAGKNNQRKRFRKNFLSIGSRIAVAVRRVRKDKAGEVYLVGDSGAHKTGIVSKDAMLLKAPISQAGVSDITCHTASGGELIVSGLATLPGPFPQALVIDQLEENLLSIMDLCALGYNALFRATHHNDPHPLIVFKDDGTIVLLGDNEYRIFPAHNDANIATRPKLTPPIVPKH
jgi:hypothetical protein